MPLHRDHRQPLSTWACSAGRAWCSLDRLEAQAAGPGAALGSALTQEAIGRAEIAKTGRIYDPHASERNGTIAFSHHRPVVSLILLPWKPKAALRHRLPRRHRADGAVQRPGDTDAVRERASSGRRQRAPRGGAGRSTPTSTLSRARLEDLGDGPGGARDAIMAPGGGRLPRAPEKGTLEEFQPVAGRRPPGDGAAGERGQLDAPAARRRASTQGRAGQTCAGARHAVVGV